MSTSSISACPIFTCPLCISPLLMVGKIFSAIESGTFTFTLSPFDASSTFTCRYRSVVPAIAAGAATNPANTQIIPIPQSRFLILGKPPMLFLSYVRSPQHKCSPLIKNSEDCHPACPDKGRKRSPALFACSGFFGARDAVRGTCCSFWIELLGGILLPLRLCGPPKRLNLFGLLPLNLKVNGRQRRNPNLQRKRTPIPRHRPGFNAAFIPIAASFVILRIGIQNLPIEPLLWNSHAIIFAHYRS